MSSKYSSSLFSSSGFFVQDKIARAHERWIDRKMERFRVRKTKALTSAALTSAACNVATGLFVLKEMKTAAW